MANAFRMFRRPKQPLVDEPAPRIAPSSTLSTRELVIFTVLLLLLAPFGPGLRATPAIYLPYLVGVLAYGRLVRQHLHWFLACFCILFAGFLLSQLDPTNLESFGASAASLFAALNAILVIIPFGLDRAFTIRFAGGHGSGGDYVRLLVFPFCHTAMWTCLGMFSPYGLWSNPGYIYLLPDSFSQILSFSGGSLVVFIISWGSSWATDILLRVRYPGSISDSRKRSPAVPLEEISEDAFVTPNRPPSSLSGSRSPPFSLYPTDQPVTHHQQQPTSNLPLQRYASHAAAVPLSSSLSSSSFSAFKHSDANSGNNNGVGVASTATTATTVTTAAKLGAAAVSSPIMSADLQQQCTAKMLTPLIRRLSSSSAGSMTGCYSPISFYNEFPSPPPVLRYTLHAPPLTSMMSNSNNIHHYANNEQNAHSTTSSLSNSNGDRNLLSGTDSGAVMSTPLSKGTDTIANNNLSQNSSPSNDFSPQANISNGSESIGRRKATLIPKNARPGHLPKLVTGFNYSGSSSPPSSSSSSVGMPANFQSGYGATDCATTIDSPSCLATDGTDTSIPTTPLMTNEYPTYSSAATAIPVTGVISSNNTNNATSANGKGVNLCAFNPKNIFHSHKISEGSYKNNHQNSNIPTAATAILHTDLQGERGHTTILGTHLKPSPPPRTASSWKDAMLRPGWMLALLLALVTLYGDIRTRTLPSFSNSVSDNDSSSNSNNNGDGDSSVIGISSSLPSVEGKCIMAYGEVYPPSNATDGTNGFLSVVDRTRRAVASGSQLVIWSACAAMVEDKETAAMLLDEVAAISLDAQAYICISFCISSDLKARNAEDFVALLGPNGTIEALHRKQFRHPLVDGYLQELYDDDVEKKDQSHGNKIFEDSEGRFAENRVTDSDGLGRIMLAISDELDFSQTPMAAANAGASIVLAADDSSQAVARERSNFAAAAAVSSGAAVVMCGGPASGVVGWWDALGFTRAFFVSSTYLSSARTTDSNQSSSPATRTSSSLSLSSLSSSSTSSLLSSTPYSSSKSSSLYQNHPITEYVISPEDNVPFFLTPPRSRTWTLHGAVGFDWIGWLCWIGMLYVLAAVVVTEQMLRHHRWIIRYLPPLRENNQGEWSVLPTTCTRF